MSNSPIRRIDLPTQSSKDIVSTKVEECLETSFPHLINLLDREFQESLSRLSALDVNTTAAITYQTFLKSLRDYPNSIPGIDSTTRRDFYLLLQENFPESIALLKTLECGPDLIHPIRIEG